MLRRRPGEDPATALIFYTNGYDIWIWNDAQDEPPRKTLRLLLAGQPEYLTSRGQRSPDQDCSEPQIAGRMYQIEAIKRVVERFAAKHRKALIVQATGTGKTRVADLALRLLLRAKWAKRILFLCDRKELRKQAHNAFKEFLPGEPRTFVTSATSKDRDKRIYLATYPAMMECFETLRRRLLRPDHRRRVAPQHLQPLPRPVRLLRLPPGRPHRHAGRVHRPQHLQALRLRGSGPHRLLQLRGGHQRTAAYLVPFEVVTHTTQFLREGIKYSEMTEEQQRATRRGRGRPRRHRVRAGRGRQGHLQQGHQPDHPPQPDGERHPGRHRHPAAASRSSSPATTTTPSCSQNLFDEMYPQYGGKFCRVIDNYDPRAEELIDDFKGEGTNPDLTIAISVDMLDTGIDVPEIVNLVFAKPVYSYVKFWQMIGRGTRLVQNLFGPGKHKTALPDLRPLGELRVSSTSTTKPPSRSSRSRSCSVSSRPASSWPRLRSSRPDRGSIRDWSSR